MKNSGENGDRYIQFVHNPADCSTFTGIYYKAISGVDKEVLSKVKKTYQRDDEKMRMRLIYWLKYFIHIIKEQARRDFKNEHG